MRIALLLLLALVLFSVIPQSFFVVKQFSSKNVFAVQPLGITANGNYLYVTTLSGVLTLSLNLTVINFTYDYGAAIPLAVNDEVYVTNYLNDTLDVIKNGVIINTITLGGNFEAISSAPSMPRMFYGYGMAYDPHNDLLYVTDSYLGYVVVINLATGQKSVVYGFYAPTDAIYDPNNGYVYILNYYSNNVTVMSGTSIINVISAYFPPSMGVVAGNLLYIASFNYNLIDVINLTSGAQKEILTGNNPYFLTYDPDNGKVYVTEFGSNSILVLYNGEVVGNYTIGSQPAGILYYNGLLYVVLYGEDKILALNPNTMQVVYSLSLNHYYSGIISAFGNIYVTEYYNNRIVELNSEGEVVRSLTLINPYSITFGNDEIFVTCPTNNRIVILSQNLSVIGYIKVPDPTGITYYNGLIYATSFSNNKLYIISPSGNVISNISVNGEGPSSITVYENRVVVSDVISEQLSIYNGTWIEINLTFSPLALFSYNDFLYVIGNGTIEVFKGFEPVNKIYLNRLPNMYLLPPISSIEYNGLVYIPYGNQIYVFNGSNLINSIQLNKTVIGIAELNGKIYAVSPFSSLFILQQEFTITFHEEGLPNGTRWGVIINNTAYYTTSPILTINLTQGLYNFSLISVNGYRSNITSGVLNVVNNLTIFVKFSPIIYLVTFREEGLSKGTKWGVEINGTAYYSTNSSLTVTLPYGVYKYQVLNVSGYYSNVSEGVIVVPNTSIILIKFSPIVYIVTFKEIGLPNGTKWGVIVNGTTYLTDKNVLTLNLTYGTYSFYVSNVTGYYSNITHGILVVNSSKVIYVNFSPIFYSVKIILIGLPNGLQWEILIDNHTLTFNSSTVMIKLPYGVYTYYIELPNGYTSSQDRGVITVNKNLILNISVIHINESEISTFTSSVTSSTNFTVYKEIGVVIIILIAILLAIFIVRKR